MCCVSVSYPDRPTDCLGAVLLLSFKKSFGCGMSSERDKEAYAVMRQEYKKLGPMAFAEGAVLGLFITLVVLWFTREPGFMKGWATVLFNMDGQ